MCIICTGEYKNLTEIDCSGCTTVTSIPYIKHLRILKCSWCTSLTSISMLNKLYLLNCSWCTSLTSIPILNNLYGLPPLLFHTGCRWLPNNLEFKNNLRRLIVIQKFVKKILPLKRLNIWLNSSVFNEWYYSPGNPGYKRAIARINKRTKNKP